MAFDGTDLFYGLATGNPVAWMAFAGIIGCVGFGILFLILWWKMPQVSKALFKNNFGTSGPVVAECYETNHVNFTTPTLFRNSLMKFKSAWYVPPKIWATATDELKKLEIDALTSVYSIGGAAGQMFFNYAMQAQIVNPKLAALMQHEEVFTYLKKNNPKVPIDAFIEALKEEKAKGEKYVEMKTMYLNLPIDIKMLKTSLRKSLSKSNMTELENKVKADAIGNAGEFNKVTIAIILILITLLVSGVSLAKLMGLF